MDWRGIKVCVAVAALSACATTPKSDPPLFRTDIGVASAPDVLRLARDVIDRYGYQIDTSEETPEIRLLTHWRPRLPFPDEEERGITSAETRILVVARPRSHTDLAVYYHITFTMENRVGTASRPTWDATVNTPMFRAYARDIANDLRQLVSDIGVRRNR